MEQYTNQTIITRQVTNALPGGSKHSRRTRDGSRFLQWSYTKRNPWTVRNERRAAAKRAKLARKINR
jgi:hypothetical protein